MEWGGAAIPVDLGVGQVIAGWDDGLVGARPGERRRLVIGSDNAYGEAGQSIIPPTRRWRSSSTS